MPPDDSAGDCKAIFALLSEYLDLELPPDACDKIRTHIAGCAPCVAFVESLQKTIALCRRYDPSELPTPLGDQARDELLAAYRRAAPCDEGVTPTKSAPSPPGSGNAAPK